MSPSRNLCRLSVLTLFCLLYFNIFCNVAFCQDIEEGDRVVVTFGHDEIEGTVIDIRMSGRLIEIEYEEDGDTVTRTYPADFVELVEPASSDDAPEMEFRTWTDSTGKHKIRAIMISNEDDHVELEKEDGRVVKLPIAKLSKADQKYLTELTSDNPFAGGVRKGSSRSRSGKSDLPKLRLPSVKPEFGTNIVSLFIDDWSYQPDPGNINNKLKSIRYRVDAGDKAFFNETSGLRFSLNKKMAATMVTNSFNEKYSSLVVFDLEKGKMADSARIPMTEIDVLAISNDGKKIATVADNLKGSGAKKGMSIWDLANGEIRQQTRWRTAKFSERNGFEPVVGAFLSDNRLLTVGNNVILWDTEKATDLYTVEGVDPKSIAFSANNRRFAFLRGDGIFICDTLKGTCQGVLETRDSSMASLAFSQSGEFLAVLRRVSNEIRIWDLKNQEVVREFTTTQPASRSMHWVGDEYLLINGMDLYDIALRVPVWRYLHSHIGNVVSTNDGRFWFLNDSKLKSVRIPEKNLSKQLGKIDPDSLLVFKPGDEVDLEVNLPFGKSESDDVYDYLANQLEQNGISIQGGAELKMVTSVERLQRVNTEVSDFFDPWGRRGTERISFTPTRVSVKLMRGKEVLWSRTSTYQPGMHFRLEQGESAQQAANRLCEADASFFKRVKIPKKVSQLPGGKPLGESRLFDL